MPWQSLTQYESLHDKGPLPRGKCFISPPVTLAATGPYTLRLTPAGNNLMYQRNGFLIHGKNPAYPDDSSKGCIVASPKLRQLIWDSRDRVLEVVP